MANAQKPAKIQLTEAFRGEDTAERKETVQLVIDSFLREKLKEQAAYPLFGQGHFR